MSTKLKDLGVEVSRPSIYHLDQELNSDILSEINVDIVQEPEDADLMLLTVFTDNKSDINDIYKKLDRCLKLKLPGICANPDLYLGDYRYCAGFFAEYYKNNYGIMHYVGKPYKNMFDYMYNSIREKVDLSKVILIGDTFHTDILGANNFGIKSALVLTGNSELITKEKVVDVDKAIELLIAEAKRIKTLPTHFINLG